MIVYNGEKKFKRGPPGKYCHIASYSLQELLNLKWDGSLYHSDTGYDSDSDDEYEPIDIELGRRAS
jgi:hypothetical protein